ncbi:MAG: diguanylate cyclase [Pseudomonadota bacterium]
MPSPAMDDKRTTLSLSQQTMLLLGGFVLMASLVTGIAFYETQRSSLIAHNREEIDSLLNRAQETLKAPIDGLGGDILLLAEVHAARTVAGGACQNYAPGMGDSCVALERLANIFEALLHTHPEYIQVRLIGLADNGRELLRYDRRHGQVIRIPESELQAKGDRPYMRDTLALPKGSLYLSRVDLNQEHGKIEEPHNPVIRMATPLLADDGALFGILIVNIAYGPILDQVSELTRRGAQLYVTNHEGDLLLAPDRSLTFGFDLGQRHRVQDIHPELDTWFGGYGDSFLENAEHLIGSRRVELHPAWPDRALSVFAAQPMATLTDELRTSFWQSLGITAALMLLGLLLSRLATRGISFDLRQLAQAAERFAKGDISPAVPQSANREVRELGEAFSAMRAEVIERNTELRDQEDYLRTIIETSTEGIITADAHGIMHMVNPVAAEMFGYHPEDMIGQSINTLMPSNYADQHDQFMQNPKLARGEKPLIGRTVLGLRRDGSTFPINIGLAKFERHGERMFTAFIQDVSALHEAEEAVRHAREIETLAYYDPLTQLANRRRLRERMNALFKTPLPAERAHAALVMIDLDGFKDVNDRLGHEAGDHLLREIANRMREQVRAHDMVARLGGDEFAILLTHLRTPEELEHPLDALLERIGDDIRLGDQLARISASMGVSFYPDDAETPDDMFRHADIAMYRAKALGRNRFMIFRAEMEEEILHRHDLRKRLTEAIESQQLELHYQPQANLGNGKIAGVEALVRWNDPQHGRRTPAEFIPLAEESDLIVQLGDWVIETALCQLEKWNRTGLRLEVSVNVATRQFQKDDFVDKLRARLAAHPEVAPGQLKLEITETAAMADFDQARQITWTAAHSACCSRWMISAPASAL